MAQIKTYFRSSLWQQKNLAAEWSYSQCGTFWQDATPLQQSSSLKSFAEALTALNGFYAVVQQQPGKLFAAVDHIRSIPLFYGQRESTVFLSDEAEWVRQGVGDEAMDNIACQEFQLAGYVTGPDTLFPNVKQLQAGECLTVTEQADEPKIETQRYYRFLHAEPREYNEALLEEALDQTAVASIQRLVDYANGRQIVIPLSGGYDSRLIAALLKRQGYENILTFTYGVPGNKESQYSKQVADALGLRWHFVEYSNELWRQAWQSDARWQYQKWGSGWASLAHMQDWLAVKIMKENGSIDTDAVFVPGHSGDFVAGSHIPDAAFTGEPLNFDDACRALFQGHYYLAPINSFSIQEKDWLERIKTTTEAIEIEHAWQYADAYEKWDWQERQAKYICNSVRVYEFFNYDWWLPLWDKEFVKFWQNVPLEIRQGRKWYVSYVKLQYYNISKNNEIGLGNSEDLTPTLHTIKNLPIFKVQAFKNIARKLWEKYIKISGKGDQLSFKAWFTKKEHKDMSKKGLSILGMLSKKYIDESTCKNNIIKNKNR